MRFTKTEQDHIRLRDIRRQADGGSLRLELDPTDWSGIVTVKFEIGGIKLRVQYSDSSAGCYALGIQSCEYADEVKILEALCEWREWAKGQEE